MLTSVIQGGSDNYNNNKDLENFIERTWRASISPCSALRKLINGFSFSPTGNSVGERSEKNSLEPRIS